MMDKSTPEWQSGEGLQFRPTSSYFDKIGPEPTPPEKFARDLFLTHAHHAFHTHRISSSQYDELILCETPERGEERLKHMIRGNGEINLMRDMWKAERDARNRWWITIAIAAASSLVVLAAIYYS